MKKEWMCLVLYKETEMEESIKKEMMSSRTKGKRGDDALNRQAAAKEMTLLNRIKKKKEIN